MFSYALRRHFLVRAEKCFSDPTLDVRNACAKYVKMQINHTNDVPQTMK